MSVENDSMLAGFDVQAVAAQILAQPVPAPRASEESLEPSPRSAGRETAVQGLQAALATADGEATADGLLPDTLTDRGNAKLFVKLYRNDYRHVPGIGWYRWDGTRWQIDEDDTVMWSAGDLAESIATTDPGACTRLRRSSSTAAAPSAPAG